MKTITELIIFRQPLPHLCLVLAMMISACSKRDDTLADKRLFTKEHSEKVQQTGKKIIYLTIDDGPLSGCDYLITLAYQQKVALNFFVVGQHIDLYPEKFSDIIACKYVDVYNHSYTHAGGNYARFYSSELTVVADLTKNKNIHNIPSNIVRLPGKNFGKTSGSGYKYDLNMSKKWRAVFQECGYSIFGWDLEWSGTKNEKGLLLETGPDVLNKVSNYFNSRPSVNSVIILAHDQMFDLQNNADELTAFITNARQAGYEFDFIANFRAVR